MEDKKPLNFSQIEQQQIENLNMFMFIVFVPNPARRNVRMWIDGDNNETVMNIDKFIETISNTCGSAIANKLDNACHEYGIPFIFDRSNGSLKQLNELPPERHIEITPDYHKVHEKNNTEQFNVDNFFEATKKATQNVNKFGIPSFDSKFIRF